MSAMDDLLKETMAAGAQAALISAAEAVEQMPYDACPKTPVDIGRLLRMFASHASEGEVA